MTSTSARAKGTLKQVGKGRVQTSGAAPPTRGGPNSGMATIPPVPKFHLPSDSQHWPSKPEDYPYWSDWLAKLHDEEAHVNKTIEAAMKIIGDPSLYNTYFTNLKGAAGALMDAVHSVFGHGGPITVPGLFGSVQDGIGARDLMPVLALYHDIGKAIAKPGHPALGYRILHDMDLQQRSRLEELLRKSDVPLSPEGFYQVIRYHDVFGVICTGEASLPMLADVSSAVSDKASRHESRRILGLLVLLNLADLHATLQPDGLTEERVEMILSDWKEIDLILRHRQQHSRTDFAAALQYKVSEPEAAIARVSRLFVASLMRAGLGKVLVRLHEEPIEKHMRTFFGNRLDEFAGRFAHFCKLDYGLAFFAEVVKHSGIRPGPSQARDDFAYTGEELRPAIVPVLKVLNRVVEDYSELAGPTGASGRRLIVNMGILGRGGVSEKLATLLTRQNRDVEALSWLADEIGVSVIA